MKSKEGNPLSAILRSFTGKLLDESEEVTNLSNELHINTYPISACEQDASSNSQVF